MDLTSCPECAAPAEVVWRETLPSTDGPVEHARVRCVDRHCFLLPVAVLVRATEPSEESVSVLGLSARTAR